MNIVLTGFMASGKTEISRAIAMMSDYGAVDTDEMVEKKAAMSINDIFAEYGEAHFRGLEREAVREAAGMDKVVIATGGGVVLDGSNIAALRETGIVFNLAPDFDVIAQRVAKAAATRPLMRGESLEGIKKRFDDRLPYYGNCDYKIHITNGKTPAQYAEEILEIVGREVK